MAVGSRSLASARGGPDVRPILVAPATLTETWPWLLMVSEVEFCGMVMPGCTTLPCAVTMRPCASIWNEPSRD